MTILCGTGCIRLLASTAGVSLPPRDRTMSTTKRTLLDCAAFRLQPQAYLTMDLEENQKHEHSEWTVGRVVSRWRLWRQRIVYHRRHRQDDRALRSGETRSSGGCRSP